MNNLLRGVLMRRSVYQFEPRLLQDSDIAAILEAGKQLSNAAENQAWHFTILENRAIIKSIIQENIRWLIEENASIEASSLADEGRSLLNVPMMLVISGRRDLKYAQDSANAVFGSMMLAAEKYGVASCWLSFVPTILVSKAGSEIAQTIGIPEPYEPYCVGAFGYREIAHKPQMVVSDDHLVHIIK